MSQIIRTYSRKGKRVAKDVSASIDTSPERDSTSRKRKRVEVEVVTGSDESGDDEKVGKKDSADIRKESIANPRGKYTYLSLLSE